MAPHSSTLAWKIPWTEEPGRLQSMRSLRVGHDWVTSSTFHFSLSCIGEGNGNPLQYSCLENPRDGGAWWTAVYGVAQSRTQLSSSSSSRNWAKLLRQHNFETGSKDYGARLSDTSSMTSASFTFWASVASSVKWGTNATYLIEVLLSIKWVSMYVACWELCLAVVSDYFFNKELYYERQN